MNRWKLAFVLLLLFLAAVLAYANSLNVPLIYDDYVFISDNETIRTLGPLQKFLLSPAYAEYVASIVYRPLTLFSFALNYAVGGLRPTGYHVVNLLLHTLNAFLVFFMLRRLGFRIEPSLSGSLIFAIHPVHTEAVTWISGRGNVLFLFFFLVAYLLFLKIEDGSAVGGESVRSTRRRTTILLSASLMAYGLALLSKEMAITLPVLLFGHDLYYHRCRNFRWRVRRMWLYAPFVLVAVLYIMLRMHVLETVGQRPFVGRTAYFLFLIMLRAFAVYLRLLFVPTGLSLSRNFVPTASLFDMSVFPSFCLIVLVAIIGIAGFRRRRHLSFAVFWFALMMLPVSNIIPIRAIVAERFLYGPSIGFCILVACWTEYLSRRGDLRKVLATTAITAIIFCHMLLSIGRNNDWRNPRLLWLKTTKTCPTSFTAFNNLGIAYLKLGRTSEAVEAFLRSVKLRDDQVEAHLNLGNSYNKIGRLDMAIIHYKAAFTCSYPIHKPDKTHFLLADCLERSGRIQEAIEHYEAALRINPDHTRAQRRLGAIYKRKSRGNPGT